MQKLFPILRRILEAAHPGEKKFSSKWIGVKMNKIQEDFIEACNYPGKIDIEKVELALKSYLSCLRIERDVRQLKKNWNVYHYPDISESVRNVLTTIDAKAAKAAIAVNLFARFCVNTS